MKIWKRNVTVDLLNESGRHTLGETLGIEFTGIGEDYIKARMPVNERTRQPYGLLHGGASVSLAESLGSLASVLCLAPEDDRWCVGIEINANHIRSCREGFVTGTVKPIHIGRSLHVWDIRIEDEESRTVCVSRLTVSVIPNLSSG
jgi:1,4-dihydroxy-2-naphthoyl-CoA hydrolase